MPITAPLHQPQPQSDWFASWFDSAHCQRLVVDYTNVHRAEAHLVREEIITRENVEYHVFRWSDVDAIFKRIVIDERRGTPPREFVERVSKLTVDDFRFMLALYGLQVEELFGDYRLGAFDHAASPRLIAVASKA